MRSVLSVLIFIWIARLLIIFPWTPERLPYSKEPKHADLMVVLDGETYVRIDHAFDLIEQGFAESLFVPGLKKMGSRERIRERTKGLGRPIQFKEGRGVTSTYEEALETKHFINHELPAERKISTILLVTSPYHSFRAWWIFQKVLPQIKIVPTPVPFEKNWFSPDKVKQGSKAEEIYKKEQKKFLAYYLLYSWRLY